MDITRILAYDASDFQILSTTSGLVPIAPPMGWDDRAVRPRFLTLADVAEILNVSAAQAYALVRRGEIRAIKVGGRGQWRIEPDEIERYIESRYAEVAREIEASDIGDASARAD
jgi:excisionase family DNA binding protein